jgi:hypothetical protein
LNQKTKDLIREFVEDKKGAEKKVGDKKRKRTSADITKLPDTSPIDWNDPIVDKYFK